MLCSEIEIIMSLNEDKTRKDDTIMTNFRDSLTFKNYDRERVIIDSIAARLTEEDNALRNKIINYIVDNHKPFVPSDEAEKAAVEVLRDSCY